MNELIGPAEMSGYFLHKSIYKVITLYYYIHCEEDVS